MGIVHLKTPLHQPDEHASITGDASAHRCIQRRSVCEDDVQFQNRELNAPALDCRHYAAERRDPRPTRES